jgi:hypothetical protein
LDDLLDSPLGDDVSSFVLGDHVLETFCDQKLDLVYLQEWVHLVIEEVEQLLLKVLEADILAFLLSKVSMLALVWRCARDSPVT